MSGLVKGVVKRAKKGLKFIKKHWKKIVIAAAIVFTAGIATVGFAGFGAASAAAGGGVGGFLSAAGSTMAAGVASIGGTLGIGKGAALAKFGGTGYATLGTGAAAQSLGLAGSNAAMTAGRAAGLAGSSATTAGQAGYGVLANSANAAPAAGWNGAAQLAGPAAAPAGATGGFFQNNAGTLLQAGMGLVNGYMQGRAQDEQWERTKPRGMWGVGLNGTPNAQPSFSPGLMWNPNSRPGFTGNAALDSGQQIDPNAAEPVNEDYDPTLAHLARRNRQPIYGG